MGVLIFIIGPLLLVVVGMIVMGMNAAENKNLTSVVETEVKRLNEMKYEDLESLCAKEPLVEVAAGGARYKRFLTLDKIGRGDLVVRVTFQGVMNKSIEESRFVKKFLE